VKTAVPAPNASSQPAGHALRPQALVILAAMLGIAGIASLAAWHGGPRVALTALIGAAAGLALYHASFGFSATWRRLIAERRSLGIRAQIVMIGATILVSFPLLGAGEALGQPVTGFVSPVGLALAVGATLFGIGMQLAGGCGSGTLYTAGGGSLRMLAALAAFIAASLIATADPLGWSGWLSFPAFSLVEAVGPARALAIMLGVLAACYAALLALERGRHGSVAPLVADGTFGLLRGPWPLIAGALALALVNILTLLVAGRPWGITAAFALWGAKLAMPLGLDVSGWSYWRGDPALSASLFSDVTSVMDFGIMLGALAAAGAAGRFRPQGRIPLPSLLAAVLGGLLMGVGARLGTGCNIGAFFSGLASGSLHGLVWLLFALPGSVIGMRLRPRFGLE
jgi:hypothetical protein